MSTVAPKLTGSHIAILADLDRYGHGHKVRNGWKLGGFFRKAKTVWPLVALGLAQERFLMGKHELLLTQAGHAELARHGRKRA